MPETPELVDGRDRSGRFGPGNTCRNAGRRLRRVETLKNRAVAFYAKDPTRIARYLGQIEDIALSQAEKTTDRLAALKLLMTYAVGAGDMTVTVNATVGRQVAHDDPVEYGRKALALGIAWERLPPEVQAVTPKPVVATIVEQDDRLRE